AYGMIPIAGDSLTDILVQHCLVDFETAEQIKRKIGVEKNIEYTDILGLPQSISAEQAKELLQDNIQRMTKEVADCILELNGEKPVSAVFVVGGGGMIPGYTQALAEHLGIAAERVAIRGQEVMQAISFDMENARKDSLMVTPIGICLSYYEQSNNFIFVGFNDQRVKLYDNGRLSVVEAAIAAGFPNENLFPKRGAAVEYTVDGKSRMVRGEQGEAAVITVNGQEADIHTRIQNGDKVVLVPSTAGEAAHLLLDKLPEMAQQVHITINGIQIMLPRLAYVNGELKLGSYEIQNGDEIRIQNWYTVEQVAQYADIPLQGRILVNDTSARADTRVYEGFDISFVPGEEEADEEESDWQQAEEAESELEDTFTDTEGDTAASVKPGAVPDAADGQQPQPDGELQVVVNQQPVTLRGKKEFVFVDIFDFYEFDLGNSQGRSIVTLLNGRPAQHFEALHNGDVINIYWQ
ncbi:MAG: cell division protein FtsA, partial [Acetatifactor sp.]|nr:cell division protein FtsA [Acetatifactor sp.]